MFNIQANNNVPEKEIKVAVSVYSLSPDTAPTEYGKVIKNNKPEATPTLSALSGKAAIIKTPLNDNQSMQISFLANTAAEKFDMDIELNNGIKKSLTQVSQQKVGGSIAFLAKLNDVTKLIKVKTLVNNIKTIDENGVQADKYLQISKKLNFVMPSQHYIQANQLWKQNKKLKRTARKSSRNSSLEQNFNFIYIKNQSADQIIKGNLLIKNNVNALVANSSGASTSRGGGALNNIPQADISSTHKSEKDSLLPFYILPNKTAFIGKYAFGSKVKLYNASYLSETEAKSINSLKDK